MINAIIIEDEAPAMEMMSLTLSAISAEINIQAKLSSIREGIAYFSQAPFPADIIFCDVQLPDGLSFEIFRQTNLQTPVVFTTCWDKFMLKAFENNGIDYLLKPINRKDVESALGKYNRLKDHFSNGQTDQAVGRLLSYIQCKERSRVLVKKGKENILLRLEDIILFYTENKVVFVIDRNAKKYMIDKTLSDLEEELDKRLFFRANRRYIINLDFIKGYKPFEKVKLLVGLQAPEIGHTIVISQENAGSFRKWVREA